MKYLTFKVATMRFARNIDSICHVFGVLVIGLVIGCGLAISNAGADEQPAQAAHDMSDMHDMHDMHDMPGMEHMDHSMHQQALSQRGTYKRSLMTYTVPDVKLIDENGKSASLRGLMDDHSAIMLNFIFTTCTTICPVMTSTFQQVQEKLGQNQKGVRMVSISIDPENDTPAKMKEYAAKYRAGNQWTFLTGSLANSVGVQKAFGVFAGEKMSHKPITFLKAKGSDTQWVRLEGIAEAGQIIDEYSKLGSEHMSHE